MKKNRLYYLTFSFALICSFSIQAQTVIDLTGLGSSALADALPGAESGSVILLEPGVTYTTGGYAFDKSITLNSADPDAADMPKIDCTDNFNIVESASIDLLTFMNIEFFGEFDARYIFNTNVGGTIGSVIFASCYIHDLRGVFRMKDAGPGSIGQYSIVDCIVHNIRDYGILTVDRDEWQVDNILLQNSTFYKCRSFITSRNNTNTLVISGCTLNEVPATGRRFLRWRTSGQDNVLNGITFLNTIMGHGWDENASGSFAFDGYDGLGSTTWTFTNTYATNELSFEGGDTIEGFPNTMYNGTAAELWVDPYNGDFHFKDLSFEGRTTAGDPRWAAATGIDNRVSDNSVSVYPIPATENATFEFTLKEKTDVSLSLFSLTGKQIQIQKGANYSAGEHRIDISTENLSGGIYIYKLNVGSQSLTGKLSIVH